MGEHHAGAAGGCLCGAVTYRIDGPVRDVTICHCSVCRRLHGGPAAFSAARRDDLHVADPEGLLGAWEHDGATYRHCTRCGSRLFWSRDRFEQVAVAAGSLHEPTGLATSHHIFVGSAADWEQLGDGLPAYDEWTPPGARPAAWR